MKNKILKNKKVYTGIVLRENVVDSHGHIFKPENLKKHDGNNRVYVTKNYIDNQMIGKADIKYIHDQGLQARITILNFELHSIGLCDGPNIDLEIKPIKDWDCEDRNK
jgi:hypothetical protein